MLKRGALAFLVLLVFAVTRGAGAQVTSSGSTGYVPVFTTGTSIGNSPIYVNGSNIGIGNVSSAAKLQVTGSGETFYFGSGSVSYPASAAAGTGNFVGRGNYADYRLALSDGNGRVNEYYNAYWNSALNQYQYQAADAATRFMMGGSGTPTFDFYAVPAGTAGSQITNWTQMFHMYANSQIWLSARGNSSDFFINSSGNVGIGTPNPGNPLTIQTSLGNGIQLTETNGRTYLIGPGTGTGNSNIFGLLYDATAGANRINVDQNGNVGIGTTGPLYTLDVTGTGRFTGALSASSFNGSISSSQVTTALGFTPASVANPVFNGGLTVNSTASGQMTEHLLGYSNGNADLVIQGGAGAAPAFWLTGTGTELEIGGTGSTEPTSGVINVGANGKVGIGTASPVNLLNIYAPSGNSFMSLSVFGSSPAGTTGITFRPYDSGTSMTDQAQLTATDDGNYGANMHFLFKTDGGPTNSLSEKVTILGNSGYVGIGTQQPHATLEVNGGLRFTNDAPGTVQTTAWTGVLCGGDYAEAVNPAGDKQSYEPGDVLVITDGIGEDGDVGKSAGPYSTMVAGIYATKPGVVGRRESLPKDAQDLPMAMVGIVPTKVTAENGPIHRGDLLVTSSMPGYAMKGTDRNRMLGAVIGKAMGSLDSGNGAIEVLVTLQ